MGCMNVVFRFWPLLLIGLGLQFIFAGSRSGKLLADLLCILLLLIAVALSIASVNPIFDYWLRHWFPVIDTITSLLSNPYLYPL